MVLTCSCCCRIRSRNPGSSSDPRPTGPTRSTFLDARSCCEHIAPMVSLSNRSLDVPTCVAGILRKPITIEGCCRVSSSRSTCLLAPCLDNIRGSRSRSTLSCVSVAALYTAPSASSLMIQQVRELPREFCAGATGKSRAPPLPLATGEAWPNP